MATRDGGGVSLLAFVVGGLVVVVAVIAYFIYSGQASTKQVNVDIKPPAAPSAPAAPSGG